MNSKKMGITVASIGALYLIIVAWLVSWYYVPDYRNLGPEFINGSTFYNGVLFMIFWALSAPLGSMLVILGLALSTNVGYLRISLFVLGCTLLLLWISTWAIHAIPSKLFGIGGGIIVCCFLVSAWSWAKKRAAQNYSECLISDLRIVSHLFFVIAAWGLCGLLGTPLFGLRPELMIGNKTQIGAYTMSANILINLVLGWIFSALSQYIETKE